MVNLLCLVGSQALAAGNAARPPASGWTVGLVAGAGAALLAAALWWTARQLSRPAGIGDYLRQDRPARGYLGVVRSGEALRPGENQRCQHVLVITDDPEQATLRVVQPNLMLDAHDGVSVVLFDIFAEPQGRTVAGPMLPATDHGRDPSDLRALLPLFASGYDVQVFDPFGPATLHYPVLGSVDSPEAAAALARTLLSSGAEPAKDHGRADHSSERSAAQALLEGLLLADRLNSAGDGPQPALSWQDLLRLVQAGPDALSAHLATSGRAARLRTHLYFSLRQEQQLEVARQMAQALAVFGDPLVSAALSASVPSRPGGTLDVAAALLRPAAVYLRLPLSLVQTESGAALLRLLQHSVLTDLLRAGTRAGGAPPQHVAVYLPACTSDTARLPLQPETLAALRLTRVACSVIQGSPHPELAGVPGTEQAVYGHVLTLNEVPQRPAQLDLADGRRVPVWLPSLGEGRLGPVSNPLYAGARQVLGEAHAAAPAAELTRDLVLQRQLRSRAMQAISRSGSGSLGLEALVAWVDDALATSGLWSSSGDLLGPAGIGRQPTADQLRKWTDLGWIASFDSNPSPGLTTLGWNLLGEARQRAAESRLPRAQLPEGPEDEDVLEYENPAETRQNRLLSLLADHRDLTPAQLVAMTELPETTVRRDLGQLEEQRLVQSARVAGKRRYKLVSGLPRHPDLQPNSGAGTPAVISATGEEDKD